MRTLKTDSWWPQLLGLCVSALVAYAFLLLMMYRHKVWLNSITHTIRIQRRTGWLGLRTQEFAWPLFLAIRTAKIELRNDVEFRVELVNENCTQGLELARFSGKRMEKSFFQMPVPMGEPDEARMLRRTVSLFLKIKDLGCREGSDLTML